MKNKIAFLLLILTINLSFIRANDCEAPKCGVYESNRYVSFGVGPIVVIPNIGLGFRERYARYGWDTALSFSTIGYAHQFTGHLVGHRYFNPFQRNSAYLGLGVLGSGVFTNDGDGGATLSPDFVFGKELTKENDSRHFLEMHVAIPTLWLQPRESCPIYLPLMYIKYGIVF